MKNKCFSKTISLLLGLVILTQLFCAVPAMAAGDTMVIFDDTYNLPNLGDDYPSMEPQREQPVLYVDLDQSISDSIAGTEDVFPEPPARIIGRHFTGWADRKTGTPITEGTVLTSGMIYVANMIYVDAVWETDKCADLEAAVIRTYDHLGNLLSSNLLGDSFSSDQETYDLKVLNNAAYVELDFIVHEPAAAYELLYQDAAAEKTETMLTVTLAHLENKTYESGIDVRMSRAALTDGQNVISVPVTSADQTVTRNYRFNIEKSSEEVALVYGNTPFGRIQKDRGSSSWTEEQREELRQSFRDTLTYYGLTGYGNDDYYSPLAWGGADDTEIVGGIVPMDGEYRNYDKDETAVVAYIGSRFTDPGFTLYDENREAVALSPENSVKRTITYDTVSAYDFDNFTEEAATKTYELSLEGNTDENVIDILQKEKVLPGVYTIRYESTLDPDIFAERKLIVIPAPGDMNMDGYVNSLDAAVYNLVDEGTMALLEQTLAGRIYLYRGLDLDRDGVIYDGGVIDDDDRTALKDRTEASPVSAYGTYPDVSVQETYTQSDYVIGETADDNKAHLFMDYLGKHEDSMTAAPEASGDPAEELNIGDIFWVGYRIENTEAFAALGDGVYSLTLGLNYDARYITPATVLTEGTWAEGLEAWNDGWSGYSFNGFTSSAMTYSANSSTAKSGLEASADAKTLVMDITAAEELQTLTDGDYILKVPFTVNVVPTSSDTKVLDASLDANTFTLALGEGGVEGYAWDTKDALESNLADYVDFRGAFAPVLVDNVEEGAQSINEYFRGAVYTYGDAIKTRVLSGLVGLNGTPVGNFPPGLVYTTSNTIEGIPEQAGTFYFSINNVKLSMTIDKRKMTVTTDDVERTYGDPNPEDFGYFFNADDLADRDKADGFDAAGFKEGLVEDFEISCAADEKTPYDPYDPENPDETHESWVDIVIADGGSTATNYYFDYVYGKLKVTEQRDITVTAINNIPIRTSQMVKDETFVIAENTARTDDGTLEAEAGDIVDGDVVKISYTAEYSSDGSAAVTIKDMVVDETNGAGANYKIDPTATLPATGEVQVVKLRAISPLQQPRYQYTYGQSYSFSQGNVFLYYDDGSQKTGLTMADFVANPDTYGISVKAYNANNEDITDTIDFTKDIALTVPEHNGMVFELVPEQEGVEPYRFVPLEVHKKTMHVYAEPASKTYGEPNPTYTYTYEAEDFVHNQTKEILESSDSFTAHTAWTSTKQGTNVGWYKITLSGGSHENYSFDYSESTEGLTINKRELNIEEITAGVPALTAGRIAEVLAENPSATEFTVAGEATRSQVTSDAYGSDNFKITYTAVYNTTAEGSVETVEVRDVTLTDAYKGGNYTLVSWPPTAAGGEVLEANIRSCEIVEDPVLSYEYGEPLNLDSGKVTLLFDNGDKHENITFNAAKALGVGVVYAKSGRTAAQGDALNRPTHHGDVLELVIDSIYDLSESELKTEAIEVRKAPMHVLFSEVSTSVYGETPELAITYDPDNFKYGESATSTSFKEGLTAPLPVCGIDETSPAGDYTVTISEGQAANYEFVYPEEELTHTITKRPLKVTAITGGVEPLTSDLIFINQPSTVIDVPSTADLTQMTVEGRVNDDELKIAFGARYTSTTPTEEGQTETVGIINPELMEGFGKENYELTCDVETVDLGFIYDREINRVTIVEQPTLGYTYGDVLDLDSGKVTITYDSGYKEEDLTFLELLNHERITLTYTGTGDAPEDGEVLTVPYHDGKTITISARTVHVVENQVTSPITVAKKVLTYGTAEVEPIVYDGETTLTTGTIVLLGEENGNVPTATGVFNFEDALAGEDKTVYITDVQLDNQAALNYSLEADETTALGTIQKAPTAVEITAEDVVLSEENIITVTPPEMTQMQLSGGAAYEYSADGGQTWQDSNVFDSLTLGETYHVVMRFAETDNFKASQNTTPVEVKAYLNKITLILFEEQSVLKSFFTNVVEIGRTDEFDALVGDLGGERYEYYTDEEAKLRLRFPFVLTGDVKLYLRPLRLQSMGGGVVRFTVKFETNGGSKVERVTVAEEAVIKEPTAPTKEGCIFGGWYTDEALTEAYDFSAEVKKSFTLYAKWTEEEPDIPDVPIGPPEWINPFADVPESHWAFADIRYVNEKDLMQGTTETAFEPDQSLTRAMLVTVLYRAEGEPASEGSVYDISFEDVNPEAYYREAILWGQQNGIILGYNEAEFRPDENVTREQIAAIMLRYAQYKGTAPTGAWAIRLDYADLAEISDYAVEGVMYCTMKGIMQGRDDNLFEPNGHATRAEIAAILHRAAE